MGRETQRNRRIKAMAWIYRYIIPWLSTLLPILLGGEYMLPALGTSWLAYALYDVVGFHCQWKHIGCAGQDANHQPMRPDSISWESIRKDVYGSAAVFGLLGAAAYIGYFFGR